MAPPNHVLELPDELILLIGQAIAAHRRIADLVAAARTCRKLHRVLLGLAYLEAIYADAKQQQVTHWPPRVLTFSSPLLPTPVALWAAEHNRLDTLARLAEAQVQAQVQVQTQAQEQQQQQQQQQQQSSRSMPSSPPSSAFARLRLALPTPTAPTPLTCAYWYPPPYACQHDLSHIRYRARRWYEGRGPATAHRFATGWCTALHIAAQHGHDAMVRDLVVSHGACVDATAKHVCVCRSQHMRLLLHDQAFRRPDKAPVTTPLHVALANGRDSTARLLVELGANWADEIVPQASIRLIETRPYRGNYYDVDVEEQRLNRLDWDDPGSRAITVSAPPEPDEEVFYVALLSNRSRRRRREAPMRSQLGNSSGATGLRIAAANAMLPFLEWLVCREKQATGTATTLRDQGGEFYDDDRRDEVRFGALHYAAHAGCCRVGINGAICCPFGWRGAGSSEQHSDSGNHGGREEEITSSKDISNSGGKFTASMVATLDTETIHRMESAADAAAAQTMLMERLVALLFELGVELSPGQDEGDGQEDNEENNEEDEDQDEEEDDGENEAQIEEEDKEEPGAALVAYARRWGNDMLADILERSQQPQTGSNVQDDWGCCCPCEGYLPEHGTFCGFGSCLIL